MTIKTLIYVLRQTNKSRVELHVTQPGFSERTVLHLVVFRLNTSVSVGRKRNKIKSREIRRNILYTCFEPRVHARRSPFHFGASIFHGKPTTISLYTYPRTRSYYSHYWRVDLLLFTMYVAADIAFIHRNAREPLVS